MRESFRTCARAALLVAIAAGCAPHASPGPASYSIGSPAEPGAIAALDRDVSRDGSGLPSGHGTAADGAAAYAATCRSCHGEHIALARWRYPTALFDYVRRAMPPTRRRPLSSDTLYAIVAYLLYTNGRVGVHEIVDRAAIAAASDVHSARSDDERSR